MKKLFFLTLLFVSFLFLASAQTNTQDSAWIRDNYTKIEKYIPMRDGVKLFTAIYLPIDKSEKHSILLRRTPYSCSPYGEDKFPAFWNTYHKYYFRENYIMVVQDVRGRYMSEGEFVDVRPFNPNKKTNQDVDEASDAYDTVDWLIKNLENNNGRVGVFGISYPGFYAIMAALSKHPAVKAVSPQGPVTDWFMGDDFHHNGAFFIMDAFSFYFSRGFGNPRPMPTMVTPGFRSIQGTDNYKFYLETGSLKNFAKIVGDSMQFWKDLYANPNYNDFWKARNPRNFVTDVKPATLVVGGLFDAENLFGAWNLYKAIERKSKNNNRIIMGPWFHGEWGGRGDGSYLGNVRFDSKTSEWYQNNVEIPFFNYHLKGKGSLDKLAEATVFFTGENRWHQLPQWPPANMQPKNLYLQPGGKLDWNKPAVKKSSSEYISDPSRPVPYTEDVHLRRTREYMTDDQRFASRRTDVLVFQTDVLTDDITLGGELYAELFASLSTTDADFVVKLIDVFPDDFKYLTPHPSGEAGRGLYPMGGYQMLVRGEVMRGKFRNSFEKPEAFKPGKVEKVKFYLPDVAHTFKKGHRIMVQIQSSWFPLVDRNPQKFINIYEADDSDFQKCTIKIHHDAANSSSIILPILK